MKNFRLQILPVTILFSLFANACATLSSIIATPTITPIPQTPTPEYNVKLVEIDGHLTLNGGLTAPAMVHTVDGDIPAGMSSMDYASTRLDISDLANKPDYKIIGLVFQMNSSGKSTHSVGIDKKIATIMYIDKEYVVFPSDVVKVEEGGPFIRLEFYDGPLYESSHPLAGWKILIKQGEKSIEGNLSANGIFDLSNVTADPLQITLTEKEGGKVFHYKDFVTLRGAIKELVVYTIWGNK